MCRFVVWRKKNSGHHLKDSFVMLSKKLDETFIIRLWISPSLLPFASTNNLRQKKILNELNKHFFVCLSHSLFRAWKIYTGEKDAARMFDGFLLFSSFSQFFFIHLSYRIYYVFIYNEPYWHSSL